MSRVLYCSVFLMCMAGLSLPANLWCHHQLGLPHYLYSENYPQIPTMVIDADAEGFQVTFSIYPGNPQPGETVRLKIYIKNSRTGAPYMTPITMSVSMESFLDGREEIIAPVQVASEYNEYKMSYEFPDAEQYFVNVTFEPRTDFFEKIPFPVVIGQTDFSMIPVGAGIVFVTTFILVGFTKKRNKHKTSGEIAVDHV